jgi:alkanesulfonate monooxygenase SsuD/methylene tetrahydromethanopterin reductase-like flavin-dependent oxidoreductase (luciferase family)
MDSLEPVVSLTYLADNSGNIRFGTMVSPLSFRDPIMLARQAMALDDLSGGRMILGVGAGWFKREHEMFGYTLSDIKTRMDRFEEGVEVISALIRSEEPVTYEGRFFQLNEAQLLPRPQRQTPIMLGGNGPKRTMPLVARYADIWSCDNGTLDLFKERSLLLDELLTAEGRQPSDVKRTVMVPVLCWQDEDGRERIAQSIRSILVALEKSPTNEVIETIQKFLPVLISGSPEHVIEELDAYASAGVEELMIMWMTLDDIEGLGVLAEEVLPHFKRETQ